MNVRKKLIAYFDRFQDTAEYVNDIALLRFKFEVVDYVNEKFFISFCHKEQSRFFKNRILWTWFINSKYGTDFPYALYVKRTTF